MNVDEVIAKAIDDTIKERTLSVVDNPTSIVSKKIGDKAIVIGVVTMIYELIGMTHLVVADENKNAITIRLHGDDMLNHFSHRPGTILNKWIIAVGYIEEKRLDKSYQTFITQKPETKICIVKDFNR